MSVTAIKPASKDGRFTLLLFFKNKSVLCRGVADIIGPGKESGLQNCLIGIPNLDDVTLAGDFRQFEDVNPGRQNPSLNLHWLVEDGRRFSVPIVGGGYSNPKQCN